MRPLTVLFGLISLCAVGQALRVSHMTHTMENISDKVDLRQVNEVVKCTIIGGGWSGLLMYVRLLKLGMAPDAIRLIDENKDLGGTWYNFQYPGVAVDSEAYLEILEDVREDIPSRVLPSGKDILKYSTAVAKHYNIYDRSWLQTRVEKATYNEEENMWLIETNSGASLLSKFVVMATGYASAERSPRAGDFKGSIFVPKAHWNTSSFTKDQVIGLIGTGPSAAQILPEIKDKVQKVFVFQKNAHWVFPRPEGNLDRKFILCHAYGGDTCLDTMRDYAKTQWGSLSQQDALNHLTNSVQNLTARYQLTPTQPLYCRRPIFSNTYLRSFNEPSVELVSVPAGVQHFGADHIVANDKKYHVDALIMASGYNFNALTIPIVGRKQITLSNSMMGLYGVHYKDFPNFFRLGLKLDVDLSSFISAAFRRVHRIGMIVQKMESEGWSTVEPTQEAIEADASREYTAFLASPLGFCRSWIFRNASARFVPSHFYSNRLHFLEEEELEFH